MSDVACKACGYNEVGESELPVRERVFLGEHWRAALRQTGIGGWLVIAVRRHIKSLTELSENEMASLGPVLVSASRALVEVVGCERTYVVEFSEAMPHLHFNVVARMGDMPSNLRAFGVLGYDSMPHLADADLDELARRLARAWPSV